MKILQRRNFSSTHILCVIPKISFEYQWYYQFESSRNVYSSRGLTSYSMNLSTYLKIHQHLFERYNQMWLFCGPWNFHWENLIWWVNAWHHSLHKITQMVNERNFINKILIFILERASSNMGVNTICPPVALVTTWRRDIKSSFSALFLFTYDNVECLWKQYMRCEKRYWKFGYNKF